MAKIKFRIDLLAPEKFPSEILVGLVREYNEDKVTVKFPTSKECVIEGDEIRIRKSDIEKTLNLKLPDWNVGCITNTTIWQRTILEIDGIVETTEDELIVGNVKEVENPSQDDRRQFIRVPVGLNLPANVKTEQDCQIYGNIIDISNTGVGISSTILPELDQMIELSFEFPDIDLKFENAKAVVEWKRDDLQRFGARWIELKEEDKQVLRYLAPVKV